MKPILVRICKKILFWGSVLFILFALGLGIFFTIFWGINFYWALPKYIYDSPIFVLTVASEIVVLILVVKLSAQSQFERRVSPYIIAACLLATCLCLNFTGIGGV
ncbi:hypothetical protein R50073_11510 [Maricurvus nonylphenolicus]